MRWSRKPQKQMKYNKHKNKTKNKLSKKVVDKYDVILSVFSKNTEVYSEKLKIHTWINY